MVWFTTQSEYMGSRYADWCRDVNLSAHGLVAYHKMKRFRIGALRHVVRIRKPRSVYVVSCKAHDNAHSKIIAAILIAQLQVKKLLLLQRQTLIQHIAWSWVGRPVDQSSHGFFLRRPKISPDVWQDAIDRG